MVRAWYIEGEALENPREEHQRLPPLFITLEDVYRLSGVEHIPLNPDTCETDGSLEKIKEERGYNYEDVLETPSESELLDYYKEHLHENEESRLVLEGCAYYDVRDCNDEWIRIEVASGDLLIIPGGCYHRFMLDEGNFCTLKRLFLNNPQYTAHPRPADAVNSRQEYLDKLKNGEFQCETVM